MLDNIKIFLITAFILSSSQLYAENLDRDKPVFLESSFFAPTWNIKPVETTGAELSWWRMICNPLSNLYSSNSTDCENELFK